MIWLRGPSAQTDAFCHSSLCLEVRSQEGLSYGASYLYESVGYADAIGQGERIGDEADRVWHCLIYTRLVPLLAIYGPNHMVRLKIAVARDGALGDAPDNLIRLRRVRVTVCGEQTTPGAADQKSTSNHYVLAER